MQTDFVFDALRLALLDLQPVANTLVHHSGGGSVREHRIRRATGSGWRMALGWQLGRIVRQRVGRNHQRAVQGRVIRRRGPWKTRESVELDTLKLVHWSNHIRLLKLIGCTSLE